MGSEMCIRDSDNTFDDAVNSLFSLINASSSVERMYVILDVPWVDDGRNKFRIANRLLVNQTPLIDGMLNSQWRNGNEKIRMLSSAYPKIKIIDPIKVACPSLSCTSLMYKDNDHLRSSYVRDHALWIDHIFQK